MSYGRHISRCVRQTVCNCNKDAMYHSVMLPYISLLQQSSDSVRMESLHKWTDSISMNQSKNNSVLNFDAIVQGELFDGDQLRLCSGINEYAKDYQIKNQSQQYYVFAAGSNGNGNSHDWISYNKFRESDIKNGIN